MAMVMAIRVMVTAMAIRAIVMAIPVMVMATPLAMATVTLQVMVMATRWRMYGARRGRQSLRRLQSQLSRRKL
jgi:hypothetical protein